MANYWNVRYLQALWNAGEARSEEARAAYHDLATHYQAMRRACECPPFCCAFRLAA